MVNNLTLYEAFYNSAMEYQDRTALIYENEHFTYSHVLKRVNALAGAISSLGYKRDDVITLMLPNIPMMVYLIYAVNQIGAIANIIHPLTSFEQVKKYMDKSNSKIIFALDTRVNELSELTNQGIKVYGCSPVEELPFYKKIFYYRKHHAKPSITTSFTLLRHKPLIQFDRSYLKDAFYMHSSGTTGEAKTVAISSFAINSLAASGLQFYNLEDAKGIGMLCVLPMFHGFGLCMGLHISLIHGAYDVLMPKFHTKKVIKYIHKNLVHSIIGVPILYEALLRNPSFKGSSLRHLKYAFVGGDHVSESLCTRFNERMVEANASARLFAGYGLTESVAVASVNTPKDNKLGSMGKAAPHVEIRAFSPDQRMLALDEPGELYISGDTLMNGYRFETIKTDPFYIDTNQVRWVKTGDYGKVDADGYVYFLQRLKRIIKISGVNVFPSEIENVVIDLPYVFDCYVKGVKSNLLGNVLKLYVVLDKAHKAKTYNDEINSLIIRKFGIYALPKTIIYLDHLPKNLMGKVDESKLLDME